MADDFGQQLFKLFVPLFYVFHFVLVFYHFIIDLCIHDFYVLVLSVYISISAGMGSIVSILE